MRQISWRSILVSVNWRFIGAWLATMILIWTSYAIAHRTIVDNMERDLEQRVETDTLVLEDHASRVLDGVVTRLEAVAELSDVKDLAQTLKFSQKLRDLLFDDTVVRSLSLVDPNGAIVVSSNRANIGKSVTESVWESLGEPADQARKGVHFTSALAQRDLADQVLQVSMDGASQTVWLGHIDAKTLALPGHRWVVVINSGVFQNFWSAATRRNDFQVGLYSYSGQRLVGLGQGPAASALVSKGIKAALLVRENGKILADELTGWLIRYRASTRHPAIFVMFVDRASQVQEQLDRTSALRWSALGGSMVVSLVMFLFYLSSRRYHQFAWTNKQLRQEAHTDALTGLANRRAFDELVPLELTRAGALGLPLSLMILDLDHFKSINDRYGHSAGDVVLKEMAGRWQALLRSNDLIARIGGEEFCVVLPGTGLGRAEAVALKLLEETRRVPVADPNQGALLPVTVSIGLLGFDTCPVDAQLASLFMTADSALYRAKGSGRDRVVTVSLHGKHQDRMRFLDLGQAQADGTPKDDADGLHPAHPSELATAQETEARPPGH
jgi:diguanylate cyclase (GGDEF)-like protein